MREMTLLNIILTFEKKIKKQCKVYFVMNFSIYYFENIKDMIIKFKFKIINIQYV